MRKSSSVFVPGGNKRCFHPRDVVKLLSRVSSLPSARSRPSHPSFCTLQSPLVSQPFPPTLIHYSLSSSQMLSNLTSHMGFAKMIYDRFCSLYLYLSSLFCWPALSREHLHHPGCSRNVPFTQGRFRSEWVTTARDGTRDGVHVCMYVCVCMSVCFITAP